MTDARPATAPAPDLPVTRERGFWPLIGHAAMLGVGGALFSLAFLQATGKGEKWSSPSGNGWFDGRWWWLPITVAAGVLVGLLRRWTRLPAKTANLVEDLRSQRVDASTVPGIVAVSAVSLIGGASLGPEQALGTAGGWAGGRLAQRRRSTDENARAGVLAGFAGAYGGLFSSTLIVVAFILEISTPGAKLARKALPATIVAGAVSFAIYYLIAGTVFLNYYAVPPTQYRDWQLAAGAGFGLLAAVLVLVLVLVMQAVRTLFDRVSASTVARAAVGGACFGLVGFALPLTMFTGSEQLKTVVDSGAALGTGMLVVLVFAKMLTFAIAQGSGFVGGPIFPTLFIGGTSGVAVHAIFPSVPLGLVFPCLLAAFPGALVAAPFSLVLMAAFFAKLGALETAPVLIAVITAFLAVEGVKYVLLSRTAQRQARPATARRPEAPPESPPARVS